MVELYEITLEYRHQKTPPPTLGRSEGESQCEEIHIFLDTQVSLEPTPVRW